MRRTKLLIVCALLFAIPAAAQMTLPKKVSQYLNANYPGWRQDAARCGHRTGWWLFSGDFNGDGRTDYLVRISTGSGDRRSVHLIGFINDRSEYSPDAFLEDELSDTIRTGVSILSGGTAFTGMSGSTALVLENDSISYEICGRDSSSKIYTYKDGQFTLLRSPALLPPTPATRPTPTPPVKLPPAVIVDTPVTGIPDLTGDYLVYDASGKLDKNSGIVTYPDGKLTFKLTEGRAFSTATAYARNGLITSGWGRNATVSPDGRTIYWTNKTKWVRKN